jgi:hypothetical protein
MTLRLEELPSATASWTHYSARVALPALWAQVLSPAERAVTAHLCRGLSNREIAAMHCKSPATVKNQVSTILGKNGDPTRTRLIALLR